MFGGSGSVHLGESRSSPLDCHRTTHEMVHAMVERDYVVSLSPRGET